MIGIANCNVIRGISKKSGGNSHLPFLTAAVHLFLNFLKASLCQGSFGVFNQSRCFVSEAQQ